jgi:hypothetical protein
VVATEAIRRDVAASSRTSIGVVEPSKDRSGDDRGIRIRRLRGSHGHGVPKTLMRALAVEVSDIVGENAPEMTLAEHKHVVEAFAADAESIKNRGQRSICLGSVAASSLPVLDARSSTARSHGASLRAAPGFLCSRHGAPCANVD